MRRQRHIQGIAAAIAVCMAALSVAAGTAQGAARDDAPAGTGAPSPDAPKSALRLSLAEAIDRALASDETLAQAHEAVLAAEAGLMEARAGRWPHLDAATEYRHNIKKPAFFLPGEFADAFGGAAKVETGGDYDLSGALTATLNLWTAGRLSAAGGAAREWLASTRYHEEAARDYIRYQVRATHDQVLLAQENLSIAEGALSETEEAARVARAGFEAGTVSRFELQRAEVELANRHAPLVEARNAVDQALLHLARLCGLPPGTTPVLTDSLQSVVAPGSAQELVARMKRHSPELQALEHAVAAARRRVDFARAQRGPALQLSGQYVWQGQWDDDPLPEGDQLATSANVALGVSVPIFDGFETKGRIEGARAELRSAELELARISRDKELAVRQARLQLENALAALEGRREAVALAEEAHRLALVRLANGLATPLERLDAEAAMTTARAQLAAALYAANLAEATLELTVGAPLDPAGVGDALNAAPAGDPLASATTKDDSITDPSGRNHHD